MFDIKTAHEPNSILAFSFYGAQEKLSIIYERFEHI